MSAKPIVMVSINIASCPIRSVKLCSEDREIFLSVSPFFYAYRPRIVNHTSGSYIYEDMEMHVSGQNSSLVARYRKTLALKI